MAGRHTIKDRLDSIVFDAYIICENRCLMCAAQVLYLRIINNYSSACPDNQHVHATGK